MATTPEEPKTSTTLLAKGASAAEKVADAILRFIGQVPDSAESTSLVPKDRAEAIARNASRKAATTAGMLALPPGPLAWATIVPEMIGVWKIQSQMVADIAAVYGKSWSLSKQTMIYCLFRHTTAMAMRDLVVRVGERYLVRQASFQTLQKVAGKIGVKLTQTTVKKSLARWIPVAGALGVGSYAYVDTWKVAKTAIDFFSSDASHIDEGPKDPPPLPKLAKREEEDVIEG
ncbi:hypothetical protein [Haloferula sp. BvORR071]|uniref:hypothetical protein n=1 Tax=Haloferula sp. BvORR071 TaxID=1396141 RepID=UPI000946381E|nr:hypothetical protein [Haloferula sp. BvORR071]